MACNAAISRSVVMRHRLFNLLMNGNDVGWLPGTDETNAPPRAIPSGRRCFPLAAVVHSRLLDQQRTRWRLASRVRLIAPETVGIVMADDDKPQDRAGDEPDLTAPVRATGDVTMILARIEQGDPSATPELLPLVYEELRKLAATWLAQEKPGQTLQATALVHEAYIRLVDADKAQHWDSRGHFFAAAAESMRRILLNRARDRKRLKRGGERQRIDLDEIEVALDTPAEDLIALDEVLKRLEHEDPLCASLIKLRFFAGLSLEAAAQSLGMTRRVADRHWAYARAWLYARLSQDA